VAAITFGVMQTRVALNCNNLQSSDPHYGYVDDAINEAANAVVLMAIGGDRRNMNLFRNLRNRRYYDITVNGQAYLSRPSNLLILDSVSITRSTTAYAAATQTEYPVTEMTDQQNFGLLNKSATDYPTIFHDASESILLWPTPTTAYLTYVVVRGIRKEAALTNSGDTFAMEDIWHPIVIDVATSIMLKNMGQFDASEKWMAAAEKRVTQTVNLVGLSNRLNRVRIGIAGAP
jgi:hypothetical protein